VKRKLWGVVLLLLTAAIVLPGGIPPARADEPPPQVALRYVAQTYGANPALAQRDDVMALYRVFEIRNELDAVAATVRAPIVWNRGITGNGIKVGIVEDYDGNEGVVDFRNPYLGGSGIIRPGFYYSDYAEHATEVAAWWPARTGSSGALPTA